MTYRIVEDSPDGKDEIGVRSSRIDSPWNSLEPNSKCSVDDSNPTTIIDDQLSTRITIRLRGPDDVIIGVSQYHITIGLNEQSESTVCDSSTPDSRSILALKYEIALISQSSLKLSIG